MAPEEDVAAGQVGKKKLIMVMGVQRSGTTALFASLAHDKRLTACNESVDSPIYHKYRLRPLSEIAPLLQATPGAVLLKPLSETFYRSLEDLAAEYRDYDLRLVWIYRDPVNVFYSMHRQDWVSLSPRDATRHTSLWVRRNELALRFQKLHPDQIALIRYEDCASDPLVCRQLSAWLQLEGRSVFRGDGAQGRECLPLAVQQPIDTNAGSTLAALHEARTFRARAFARGRAAATHYLVRSWARWRRASQIRRPEWDAAVLAAPPLLPSALGGLHFWLNLGKEFGHNLTAGGPHRMKARGDRSWPFHIPLLNGKHALFFPREKEVARRYEDAGIVRFSAETAWASLLAGGSFSIFALFKPQLPALQPNNQERAVVLRIGPAGGGPAIVLEWDRGTRTSRAIWLDQGPASDPPVVATAPDSHPHGCWRVIFFQKNAREGPSLAISANGVAGPSPAPIATQSGSACPDPDCVLQLGGDEAQREALFFGAIAELIVFDRILEAGEQNGITRYLHEKFSL